MDLKALKKQAQRKGLELLAKGRAATKEWRNETEVKVAELKEKASREVPRLIDSTLKTLSRGARRASEVLEDLVQVRMQDMMAIDIKASIPIAGRLAVREEDGKKIYTLSDFISFDFFQDYQDYRSFIKQCICAVPGRSVFTRTRTLPPVPESKVSQIVRYEIQQQIPFALDYIAHDYQVLEQTAGGYKVIMAAIKRDSLEKNLGEVSIKFHPRYIGVAPFAAYNWLKFNGQIGNNGATALIDLGAKTTEVVIDNRGQFFFHRPLNLGGDDLTLAISEKLDIPDVKAERLKRGEDFLPNSLVGDEQKFDLISNKLEADPMVAAVLDRLTVELKRSFGYMRSLPGGTDITEVVLTGGGANINHIAAYMESKLGVPTRIADPLQGVEIADGLNIEPWRNRLATMLGLALRCHQQTAVDINFAK